MTSIHSLESGDSRGGEFVGPVDENLTMFMPFIGSEAIAHGALTRGQLRWNHTAVHPDVYLVNGQRRDVLTNAYAAWLWTGRHGVIAGRAAAALYADPTVIDEHPIELIAGNAARG